MAVLARLLPVLAVGLVIFLAYRGWVALFTRDLTPLQRARLTFFAIVGLAALVAVAINQVGALLAGGP